MYGRLWQLIWTPSRHRSHLWPRIRGPRFTQVKAFSLGGLGSPCCCGGGPCSITICVSACSAPLVGDPVTVKSGSTTVASGTTNGSGCVTLTIPSAGTYTVVVTDPTFGTLSGNYALTCGGLLNLSYGNPPSGSVCCGVCAIPLSLVLTDSIGSHALTFSGGFWTSGLLAAPGFKTMAELPIGTCDGFNPVTINASGSAAYQYTVTCNFSVGGNLTVTQNWWDQCWIPANQCAGCTNDLVACGIAPSCGVICGGPTTLVYWDFANSVSLMNTCGFKETATNTSAYTCSPFSWSGSLTQTSGGLASPVPGTVTIDP